MAEGKGKRDRAAEPARAEGAGQDQVQRAMDAEQRKGYFGAKVDPTPDEAYTVAGVTKGADTPETDPALRADAETAE